MIYISSPYSHPDASVREHRFFNVQAYCVELMREGFFPFSPIMYWHEAAVACDFPLDANFWDKYNMNMLRRSDEVNVLMMPGWQESKGVMREMSVAESLGMNVVKIEWRE